MRLETVTVRIGENVGPVDWSHPLAKDMPPIWREAEKNPDGFTFSEYHRQIISICMYDGWPYWKPTPAICFVGPLNSPEWTFFNSYAVGPDSIQPRDSRSKPARAETRSGSVHESGGAGTAIAQPSSPHPNEGRR